MPNVTQLDALEYDQLDFPYDRISGELSGKPRITEGQNVYVTSGNKIAKRPGVLEVEVDTKTRICDRLVVYETLDAPPVVYLVGSFRKATSPETWELYYARLETASTWTAVPSLRNVNSSTRPHEMIVYRGLLYIKSYPSAVSGEKLGTVIFDGTAGTPSTKFWGLMGPTEPAHVVDPGTWSLQANAHDYTVNYGWKYAYAYVTSTGQVSNRSDLETNPDKDPSDTGPLGFVAATTGFCPEVVVTGLADTTNIPKINIYRSTDGGGTFYYLYQINNPGATTATFVDKYLESGVSGGTFEDPVPDAALDYQQFAPSLTSNSPPPTVVSPQVVGTDTPKRSTRIEQFAGRLWFGIDNYVFFSGLEEIVEGVPEECFPSGLRGNFYKMPSYVTNICAGPDALYIFTIRETFRVTGADLDTFSARPFLNNVGHPFGHPRAAKTVADSVVFLTHDYRVGMITGGQFSVVSDALYQDLISAVEDGDEIDIINWADLDKDYIIVTAHRDGDPSESRQWVLDRTRMQDPRRPQVFWFTPWRIPTVCQAEGRLKETSTERRCIFGNYDGATMYFTYLDPTGQTARDWTPTNPNEGITFYFHTHLMTVPPGNHVNVLTRTPRTPHIQELMLERSKYPGDTDPYVFAFFDDMWTDPEMLPPPEEPARRGPSRGYRSIKYNITQAAQRIAFKIQKIQNLDQFELHSLVVVYEPGGGD